MTTKSSLLTALTTTKLGYPLYFYDAIGSTNDRALELANRKYMPVGTTVYTNHQTAGKGSDGNEWKTGANDALTLSVILDPSGKNRTVMGFYPAVALSRLLREKYDMDAHVKWPNDVLVGSKKIAGILCEATAHDQMVVGIGINLNQDDFGGELADKATSAYLQTGQQVNPETFFAQFMAKFEWIYRRTDDIITAWEDQTKMIGKTITMIDHGVKKSAMVVGVTDHGFLVIRDQNGDKTTLKSPRNIDIDPTY
jgi:BirA family biotin operon repressor/biotin-[acetyl-CoA-carboxylase] ligase